MHQNSHKAQELHKPVTSAKSHKNSHKPAIVTRSKQVTVTMCAQELTQTCHCNKVRTSHCDNITQACHCNRVCTRTHTSDLVDGDDPEAAGLWLVAAAEQLLHGEDDLLLGGGQEAPVGGSAC